jgi:hypothetical protein
MSDDAASSVPAAPAAPAVPRQLVLAPGGKRNVHSPRALPRPCLTSFGPVVEFVTRSYAPFDSFGGGYEGDDRGPSTSPNARARVTSIARLDTTTNNVTFSAFSNESAWPALPFKYDQYSYWPAIIPHLQFTGTAVPKVQGTSSVDANNVMTVFMKHAAGNPEAPAPSFMTPDINLHTTFVIQLLADGSMSITTSMTGDGFPNAEAFVRIGDGRAIMLHHYETTSGPLTGPYIQLWGDGNADMGSDTVSIPASRPK